jgi:hypothetical protein
MMVKHVVNLKAIRVLARNVRWGRNLNFFNDDDFAGIEVFKLNCLIFLSLKKIIFSNFFR